MVTSNFCIDLPKDMFNMVFENCCDSHEVQYPDSSDEKRYEDWCSYKRTLWKEYCYDIYAYLDGELDGAGLYCIEWDNDFEVAKLVLLGYISYCEKNPDFCIDVETYWKELMIKAIEANAGEIFDEDGSCDVYGEKI
jgi:hypothetical protein